MGEARKLLYLLNKNHDNMILGIMCIIDDFNCNLDN